MCLHLRLFLMMLLVFPVENIDSHLPFHKSDALYHFLESFSMGQEDCGRTGLRSVPALSERAAGKQN